MKIKNGQIKQVIEGINTILEDKLPTAVAFDLLKKAKSLEESFKLYAEMHDRLIKEYGIEGTEENGRIQLTSEGFEKIKELDELEGGEITGLTQRKMIAYIPTISMKTLVLLEPAIEVDEDASK